MHRTWLHVHVPKAGGSTIRQLMNRNFGDGFYNSNSLLETKQYTREDVSEIIRCHPWLRCFCDHKLSLDLPFDSEHASVHAICFVRDPLQRFISRFFFHRNFEEVNCIAQKMSFREFANMELVEQYAHPQTNSQINFLNGGRGNDNLHAINRALETGKTILAPIEKFDETCVCLQTLYPDDFKDLSYVRVNTSNRNDTIDDHDRQFVSELLAADMPLMQLAHDKLDQLIQKAFPDAAKFTNALAEFQDCCSRRYHNFQPPKEKGEAPPAADEIATDKSTNKPDHLNPNRSKIR